MWPKSLPQHSRRPICTSTLKWKWAGVTTLQEKRGETTHTYKTSLSLISIFWLTYQHLGIPKKTCWLIKTDCLAWKNYCFGVRAQKPIHMARRTGVPRAQADSLSSAISLYIYLSLSLSLSELFYQVLIQHGFHPANIWELPDCNVLMSDTYTRARTHMHGMHR